MRYGKLYSTVICLLLAQHWSLYAQGIAPSTDAGSISVRLSAVDRENRFITNLSKEDVSLSGDGVAQSVTGLELRTNVPAALAVLIDNSVSMEHILPNVKGAAEVFVKDFIRRGHDQAAILSLAERVRVEQQLTDEVGLLRSAIDGVKFIPPAAYTGGGILIMRNPPSNKTTAPQPGSTGLWDAAVVASKLLSDARPGSQRAIILFSDGADTSSRMKLDESIEEAIKYDVAVFAIGVADRQAFQLDPDGLKRMAERTGGRAFFPKRLDELPAIFGQIDQELRSQYVLTFRAGQSKAKTGYRKLKIEITNRARKKEKIQLAYKRGYFHQN
jgi:VWFA-related protein